MRNVFEGLILTVAFVFLAFVPHEYETRIAQIDRFDVAHRNDGAFHHVEDLCASRAGQVDTGMPGLVSAYGIPSAIGLFGILVKLLVPPYINSL